MSSPAQAAANLANAQFSTGPTSISGKAASSANSLKHGLTAQTILLPGEDEAAYRLMCKSMFETFAPDNTLEEGLIQLLCDTQWRLQRCGRIEAVILSADVIDYKAFDIMSKHGARLKKQYSGTLQEVRDLIEARQAQEEKEIKDAMIIRRADKIDGCTTDLRGIGFVFSDEEVDVAIATEDAIALAKKVLVHDRVSKMSPRYGFDSDQKKQAQ